MEPATHQPTTLVFLVHGRKQPWNTLPKAKAPRADLWEASAYPGWRSAIGHTFEDAYKNLVQLLKSVLSDVHDWPAWYREEYSKLDPECRQDVDQTISHYYQQQPLEKREWVVDGEGERFATVLKPMEACA